MPRQRTGFFSSLRLLHLALFAGQCLLLVVSLILVMKERISFADKSTDKTLQVISVLLSFAIVYGAIAIKKRRLKEILATVANAKARVAAYKRACLLQWILLETAVLLNLVCFIVTGNYAFTAMAVTVMIFYFLQGPSRLAIVWKLGITEEELDALQ
ncbi:MAG TPA: hypothetical protein VL307_14525 [Chitinophagaceae bacterium]|jgi:hypothetical protein|nr:hypothetical protein [Chitinophagaceae bacterium]